MARHARNVEENGLMKMVGAQPKAKPAENAINKTTLQTNVVPSQRSLAKVPKFAHLMQTIAAIKTKATVVMP